METLVVDVGNTAVRIARRLPDVDGEAPAGILLSRPDKIATPRSESARRALGTRLAGLATGPEPMRVAVASVSPAVTEALRGMVPAVIVVDHSVPLPFDVAMPDRAAVGADRYCNIAAATGMGWNDALVVDVGTATTFDLLCDGCFTGGLIAPGPAFAAAKLGEQAARLKPQPFGPCPLEVGDSTERAMRRGAWHVGVRGVLHTVLDLLDAYGPRPVAVTGGLGSMIRDAAEAAGVAGWFNDPLWTLRGACLLADAVD